VNDLKFLIGIGGPERGELGGWISISGLDSIYSVVSMYLFMISIERAFSDYGPLRKCQAGWVRVLMVENN